MTGSHDLVAIGTSWGGLDALRVLLPGLPEAFPAATVIVQHRAAESHRDVLRDLLGAVTRLVVCEGGDKQALEPGHVYLAPPDYHAYVEGDQLTLSTDGPVAHSRPSIDVLFESAAEAHRERCVGVVLTGANEDGSHGLARIAELGGAAIVQDPDEAVRPEMPRAALREVPDATVARLEEIPALLVSLCTPAEAAV